MSEKMKKTNKIIGIDLGTTNSCVAVMEGGEPKVITNAEGGRTTPSIVSFKGEEVMVGETAKRQFLTNVNTVASIKRHMGEEYKVHIKDNVIDKEYTPEEISAKILVNLKKQAETYLGAKVTKAVITVPAYFNDTQRQATKDAGKIAGLEVARIINEPTAAALAYGIDKSKAEQNILVFDLGGGTFDVSVLNLDDGNFSVLATSGDNLLGGDDFDNRIIDFLIDDFRKNYGVNLSNDKPAKQRLKDAAERAKKELSSLTATDINLPFLSMNKNKDPLHLSLTLTRTKFDDLTKDLVERCLKPLKEALNSSKLTSAQIDQVLLVGGSTRIPAVQELIKKALNKETLHQGINPDEVVAMGAAIQGAILTGEVDDIVLLDVTPLSLGIETLGGVFTKLIDKNTVIPTSKKQIFSTAVDNQTSVDIHVLQGERTMAKDNKSLGSFRLDGIKPASKGMPQIEVTFDINVDGIVSVQAKDLATNEAKQITISNSGSLSKEEIERMIQEAESNVESDKLKKEKVDTRNKADYLISQTKQSLNTLKDDITAQEKEKIETSIKDLEEALRKDEFDLIKEKLSVLEQEAQNIAVKAYQKAQEKQKTNNNTNDSNNQEKSNDNQKDSDEVIDAEFEEKK